MNRKKYESLFIRKRKNLDFARTNLDLKKYIYVDVILHIIRIHCWV